jgi:O-antigen/teichoic acid export membrane protein
LRQGLKTAGSVALAGSSTQQRRPPVSTIGEGLGRTWENAVRLISREHVLSLADQGVVSGTGFLTTLLIARWSGSTQLGIYALGLSLLVSAVGFQDSLILQPYQIQRHYPGGTHAERAGASLTLSILFSAGSILVLTVAALGFMRWDVGPEIVEITWAVAAIAPFALTRDFVRRFAFAQLDMSRVLLLDSAVAIIQLSALGWLGASGRLSALNACAALGGAVAFPTAVWLYHARTEFTIRVQHVRIVLKETWGLGRWLLAGRATVQLQGYVTYWIAMAMAGAAVTGVYAACMSIVGFANPLMIGLTNVLMPKSVLAWKSSGGPGLWHEAIRSAVLVAALLGSFSLVVLLAGDHVMRFLYHGKEFEGHGHLLTVLAVAMSLGTLGMPASIALATMERPRAIVMIGVVQAVLSVTLVSVFLSEWGLLGAAYGGLITAMAGTVARWVAFGSAARFGR